MKHKNIHPNEDMVLMGVNHANEPVKANLFAGQCGYINKRKRSGEVEACFECEGFDVWLTMPKGSYFTSNEGGIPDGY